MNKGDAWLCGFITLWVLLFAGKPDLHDALVAFIAGCNP